MKDNMKDGLKWVVLAFVAALLVLLLVTQKDKFIKTADLPTINVDASATQLAPGQEGVESPVDTRTPEEILAQEGSVEVVEDTSEVVEPTSPAPLPTEATGELVGGDAAAPTVIPGEVSYTVLGSNFAYDITEMKVKEGDKVTVTFRSTDGFHDWVVDEFDAATEKVSTGNETSVTFVADKKGEYEFYCSVGSHRAQGMVGTLIVE